MNKVIQVLRFLFAIFFIFSGLGYFIGFMPLPEMTGAAKQLIDAMVNSGYLMNFIKVTELVGGVLLLFDFLAPLALTFLAPIMLNILIFNIALNPAAIVMTIILTLIYLVIVWNYRARFTNLIHKEPID